MRVIIHTLILKNSPQVVSALFLFQGLAYQPRLGSAEQQAGTNSTHDASQQKHPQKWTLGAGGSEAVQQAEGERAELASVLVGQTTDKRAEEGCGGKSREEELRDHGKGGRCTVEDLGRVDLRASEAMEKASC